MWHRCRQGWDGLVILSVFCEDSRGEGPFLSKEPKDSESSSLGEKNLSPCLALILTQQVSVFPAFLLFTLMQPLDSIVSSNYMKTLGLHAIKGQVLGKLEALTLDTEPAL